MTARKIFVSSLLVLWCAFIFIMSAQNGSISQSSSDGVGKLLTSFFTLIFGKRADIAAESLSFLVRKSAHIFEYAVLGGLSYCFFNTFSKNKIVLKALLFCFLFALSDEIHQYFVPGRACLLSDVIIDTAAASVLTAIIFLIHRKREKI